MAGDDGWGGGVLHSGRQDGVRVADRRLLYHPYFHFNLLSDLPRNMPGEMRDTCGVIGNV